MKLSFNRALDLVLEHEGGYSNHPHDPGGATMKGVIQRVYDAWRKRSGLKPRTVRKIEQDELQDIYRSLYWAKVDGDDLPAGIDYCVFDAGVNSGPHQSALWLQRSLNDAGSKLVVDGIIGPVTLLAASKAPRDAVIEAHCAHRMRMLRSLKTWKTFGNGWSTRVAGVKAAAKTFN